MREREREREREKEPLELGMAVWLWATHICTFFIFENPETRVCSSYKNCVIIKKIYKF